MDIRTLAPAGAIKAPEIVPAVAPITPASAPADDAPAPLEPAAQVDLSPEAKAAASAPSDRAQYTRDADTQSLVFQVVDEGSGQVVVQLPDEHALRARAYARELAARSGAATTSLAGGATDKVA